MSNCRQFAVLQKEASAPNVEQLKRAFRAFNNLTDADAVRLAASACGILMRHENHDAARAFQLALQSEGIGASLVSEEELPHLPEARVLHRLEILPSALVIYDLLGRPASVAWEDLVLIAAGSARHIEVSRTHVERTVLRFNPLVGVWPKKISESGRKVESNSQLILEIILAGGAARYEIDAAQFPFKYVLDQPGLSIAEKFAWLVREICRHATIATLNRGARALCDGHDTIPEYPNRQALSDEMIWLLWRGAQKHRTVLS